MASDLGRAISTFRDGGFVIVTDDADRENEGDLFLLASAATTEKIGFMIRYTSGV
ncbi:MAG: bifunctional 3,4-dihydroxy-2-butanone-4-phosphate synthase/GTP cyclohydrolase II, partial [Actinobacteria bacterium]|nr:bifunctional 3,4-dihydroxy-2-butanone-4-phosphate synthase/GTP cyclohydrolase II [Actinomycetota bacterium]